MEYLVTNSGAEVSLKPEKIQFMGLINLDLVIGS